MRLAVLAAAVCVAATSALAQPLPAPASYPPVTGEKGVVTTHALSMELADRIITPSPCPMPRSSSACATWFAFALASP